MSDAVVSSDTPHKTEVTDAEVPLHKEQSEAEARLEDERVAIQKREESEQLASELLTLARRYGPSLIHGPHVAFLTVRYDAHKNDDPSWYKRVVYLDDAHLYVLCRFGLGKVRYWFFKRFSYAVEVGGHMSVAALGTVKLRAMIAKIKSMIGQ